MRGRWEKRIHECRKPSAWRRAVGSTWRCRCGKLWRLAGKREVGIYELTSWDELEP